MMISAIARMVIFRVESGVIKGFLGPAKPAMFSIYQRFSDSQCLRNNNIHFAGESVLNPSFFWHILRLIVILVFPLHIFGCASSGPTKPNLPYADNSYPAILSELAQKNPLLVQELGKLPELQDNISETELSALNRIVDLYKSNPSQFENVFNEMYKIGLPEHRKYCSPLQALFWLTEDEKYQIAQEHIQFYDLNRLLKETWGFKHQPEIQAMTEKEVLEIIHNHISEKHFSKHKYSIRRTYDNAIDTLSSIEDISERIEYIDTIRKKIFMDYSIDKKRFDKDGRKIIKKALKKSDENRVHPRWEEFITVVDRLNSPEMVNYYLFHMVTYKLAMGNTKNPRHFFLLKKGDCDDAAWFTRYTLDRAGYKTFARRVPRGLDHMGSGIITSDGYLIVADFTRDGNSMSGPFKSIRDVDTKLNGGKFTIGSDRAIITNNRN